MNQNLVIQPKTFDELDRYAQLIARSSFCPAAMKGKAGDILVAVQMGAECGLSPIQSLQNIAVINGKPSIYGDAAMALVQAHPACQDVVETFDEETMTASCTVKRKGQKPYTSTFSRKDAEKAKLWGKTGPWTQYTKRMLQMRARGFALRDKFPDALKGLITAEEARDYPVDLSSTKVTVKDTSPIKEPEAIDVVPDDLPIDEPPQEELPEEWEEPEPEHTVVLADAETCEYMVGYCRSQKMTRKFVEGILKKKGYEDFEFIPQDKSKDFMKLIKAEWTKAKKLKQGGKS